MILLADSPELAAEQLRAIIYYLTTLSWADGEYHDKERAFVAARIAKLVAQHVHYRSTGASAAQKAQIIATETAHFAQVAVDIDAEVQALFDEAVIKKEGHEAHVLEKLELRCYEVLRSFDPESRKILLETCDELILADGIEHPAEKKLRDELYRLLEISVEDEQAEAALPPLEARVLPAIVLVQRNHHEDAFFDPIERPYPTDAGPLKKEAENDRKLVGKALALMTKQRKQGEGKLEGKLTLNECGSEPFLDGFVHVVPTTPKLDLDVTVLGDLHGCYSCLKAAVLQSDFLGKLAAWRKAPGKHPEPKLILLGDYVDRGLYSYEGVLRGALTLFCHAPDQVYLLRGNHEHYRLMRGKVAGVVAPAEAIDVQGKLLPQTTMVAYKDLFESLPSVVLLGRCMFVHAGIPRDDKLEEKWLGLESLNDPAVRFEMAWSDPSSTDHVPAAMQARTSRFPFGRRQFHRFMAKIGANVLVRGHEVVETGFRTIYDDGRSLLCNIFSAGGAHNDDLPPHAPYRRVTPAALSIRVTGSKLTLTPWKIDYEPYVTALGNRFYSPASFSDA